MTVYESKQDKTMDKNLRKFTRKATLQLHLLMRNSEEEIMGFGDMIYLKTSDMGVIMQLLMCIEIKNDKGIDVEALIFAAKETIGNKAKHKFRITGEARIVAIFEGNEGSVDEVVNMVTSDIMKLGPCLVTCTPLTRLDNWEGLLGHGCNSNDGNAGRGKLLHGSVLLYEFAFDHGMSDDQCGRTWRDIALSILRQRRDPNEMMDIEIFKVLGERRVYVFSCKNAADSWETHMWRFNQEDRIFKNAKLLTQLYENKKYPFN